MRAYFVELRHKTPHPTTPPPPPPPPPPPADEKRAIARRYLEPAAAADAGVPPGSVSLADDALEALIGEYCREAGVRNLKKHVDKVYRKVGTHTHVCVCDVLKKRNESPPRRRRSYLPIPTILPSVA